MRKVFLDDLPRYESGTNKGKFNWNESVGYKINFVYDDIEGEMLIVRYDGKHLTIEYDKKEFKITPWHLYEGKIGKIIGKKTMCFKIEIGRIIKDKYRHLEITNREYRYYEHKPDEKDRVYVQKQKYYTYICNKCGYKGEILEGNLLKGRGCGCCCKSPQITAEYINSIVAKEETHWMIPYFQGGYDEAKLYTPKSGQKVKFKCPDCGRVKEKAKYVYDLYYNHSIGCSCSDGISYPNKFLRYFVYQLKELYYLKYEFEYRIGNRSYDGYIKFNNYNLLIEMDGGQHKRRSFTTSDRDDVKIDKIKNKLAKKNKYRLIRIDSEESDMVFIKDNILKSEISKMFDLNSIDWLEVDRLSHKNIVKEVCSCWNNKKEWETTVDLEKVFYLDRSTIIKYLKIGIKHNWCKYDPKEEMRKNSIKTGKCNSKQVEIFKDGLSLGVFPSCSELMKQSEELFGVKLGNSNISMVALGKQKHHKGYIFKYIESKEETTRNILCNNNNTTTTYSI